MTTRLALIATTCLAFTAYSLTVVAGHGYFGFVHLALQDAWGGQIFLDLCIALSLFSLWMIRDGKARRVRTWPYLIAIFTLGSIGALAYLGAREFETSKAPQRVTA